MWNQLERLVTPARVANLSWAFALVAAASLAACSIDERRAGVAVPAGSSGGQPGGDGLAGGAGQAGTESGCEGPSCLGVNPERPIAPGCLESCPEDDACRAYAAAPPDAGTEGCGCTFTWKPAAREGAACRCDESGCRLLQGEACAAADTCEGGNCVATAAGSSVCCALACAANEVCAPDGTGCVAAEPCSDEERRCSGALHQGCVQGVWTTLSQCSLGCSNPLDGCLRLPGQSCESDANCGEGTCLDTAEGDRVCCTGACNTACQRCSALGTECVNVGDDEACGPIDCPTDACRLYDPASVITNRCTAGRCATVEEACTQFEPQRAELECSETALCDDTGACSLPKRVLLAACTSGEQCAAGNCVATADGSSVCCSEPCDDSEVCGPTGSCAPAPVCEDGTLQCSGSNFQTCVGGQWVTERACGALGCSVQRGGCFAAAGQACGSSADCGQGTCQETATGGSVCCTAACGGACRACAPSGVACANLQEDTACGIVPCSSFDSACVTNDTNFVNACNGTGQCRTTADCGFRSSLTRCGDGGLCDGRGACEGPSVLCDNETCSGSNVCCSAVNFETSAKSVACGVGTNCSNVATGPGPNFAITCDQNADCTGNDVCCVVGTNVSSGDVRCRPTCTAEAVGAELGAPPEMLVVGQLCASQEGLLVAGCPGAQECTSSIATLPDGYLFCR
jgi:hypothetical protein